MVKGLSAEGAAQLIGQRTKRAFTSVNDLTRRAALNAKDLGCLASAGAFRPFARNRYQARWQVAGVDHESSLDLEIDEAVP